MDYYRTNITGTLNILERTFFKNFIFASTGMAKFGNSPYGLSKLATESLVRQYCELNGKDHTIFRFFNVTGYGGYGATNPDGLFYNLCKAAISGEFNLYGNDYDTPDGTAIRDYIHVLEVCRAIEFAIERPSTDSLVENLGTGEGYSVQTMIDTFKRVNNVDFKVNVLPRREGDIERSVLDNPSPYFQKTFDLETLLKL
jgi:UDP-glucose 4-epimerase